MTEPKRPDPRPRVLVIDDDAVVARAFARALAVRYEVVVRQRAAVALEEILAGARYDAIVCDLVMPEMSGPQFYEGLCAGSPEHAERIVFVTGGVPSGALQIRDFVAITPRRILAKPLALRELLAEVGAIVR